MIFAAVWLAIAILDFQHTEAIEEVKLRSTGRICENTVFFSAAFGRLFAGTR
jgi:hypothetical protein